ncbi:hypothetical protein GEV33_000331 [Tenebrio molitor]|uniref:Uncharacterized protein n=1 Tax=Tenebrio molitor TaxID=7067 RepID=A0A8J6HPE6_TENMO|nr:hypothetical protein GEV33_000331 [Tenebrio molitor]
MTVTATKLTVHMKAAKIAQTQNPQRKKEDEELVLFSVQRSTEQHARDPVRDRNRKRRRRINYGISVASKYDLETKMAALAARKFPLFPQATSRTLFQSQSTFHQDSIESLTYLNTHDSLESLNSHHSVLQPEEASPDSRGAPSAATTHSGELILSTLEPLSASLNHAKSIQARTRSDQYLQNRTLRCSGTGQAAPVNSGPNKCCAVFELWRLFLSSVLQSGHQKCVLWPARLLGRNSTYQVTCEIRICGVIKKDCLSWSTRTAWLVTQWTEVPPTSGAHLFVVSGSVQIVYNRAKISASSFK